MRSSLRIWHAIAHCSICLAREWDGSEPYKREVATIANRLVTVFSSLKVSTAST